MVRDATARDYAPIFPVDNDDAGVHEAESAGPEWGCAEAEAEDEEGAIKRRSGI